MLHQTIIPWSPERMRRLILSLIRSSGKAANVPKPASVGITSSQIRIAFGVAWSRKFPRAAEQRDERAPPHAEHEASSPPYPAGSGHQRARALQVALPQV